MNAQWKNFILWASAILGVVLVTVFYQPAAARTGSLLVWTNDRVYVMDIDTLTLERVAPASPGEPLTPSPGCMGQAMHAPCWVLVSDKLYRVEAGGAGGAGEMALPTGEGYHWENGAVSWSPDGLHLAYSVWHDASGQAELRVINAADGSVSLKAEGVDPDVAVAWQPACAGELESTGCEIGYKKLPDPGAGVNAPAMLIAYQPASGKVRQWLVTPEPLFELRWSPDNMLLYSRPQRFFLRADDHSPAYRMPDGAQLANMSPDGRYTIYYQPFTLEDCSSQDCTHLGVWLELQAQEQRSLIYNVNINHQQGGLNFIPTWRFDSQALVFFQEGKLIYYDVAKGEATIWYKPLPGKLRSVPVFSPNEEAVAFVDDQGQGYSQYRLLVINPRLQPVEHVISTKEGFRVLAWLPN
ncbi:MAG: hypothetical protein FOGNACKC_00974 [Anaerolineae bacterium]|nr:hypothetical protein [Anaerolineae bacterium]